MRKTSGNNNNRKSGKHEVKKNKCLEESCRAGTQTHQQSF